MLDDYIRKLADALMKKDCKRRDQILSELRKLKMDDSTALFLALECIKSNRKEESVS